MACRADTCGKQWAERPGVPVAELPADWDKHRAAGPIRNQQMAEYVDALVAFLGGRGTADVAKQARALGLKVGKYGGRKSLPDR